MLEHELTHVVLSLLAGGIVFYFFRNAFLFVYAFLAGFFIDVDHLIDYFLFKRSLSFNLSEFLSGKFFDATNKIYVFFHGYEYAIILFAFGIAIFYLFRETKIKMAAICLVLSISMFCHLLYDQYSYRPKPLAYSLIYRIISDFDHDKIGFR